MAKIQFTDPQVAEKFETDYETDPKVHLPGDKVNGRLENGWAGKLSNIPLKHAERWVDKPKQNLLKRKVAAPAKPVKQSKEEKEN